MFYRISTSFYPIIIRRKTDFQSDDYLISTSCKSTNSPFFFFLSTSMASSLRLRLSAMKRRKNTFGIATPRAMQMMASEA